jgi:DNA polymerase
MLVGEQPGDREDIEGAPFVGPAGRILDEAMDVAGLDREAAFLTNVVKHFRWRPSPNGKRRLHEKPTKANVTACLPWVQRELELVQPEVLVALGATAVDGLLGRACRSCATADGPSTPRLRRPCSSRSIRRPSFGRATIATRCSTVW